MNDVAGDRAGRAAGAADTAARWVLGALVAGLLAWCFHLAPLADPISLWSAAAATDGFPSSALVLAPLAAVGALAALRSLLTGRLVLPRAPLLLGIAAPLAALCLSTAGAVYPHDARYDLLVALSVTVLPFLVVALCEGAGGVLPVLAGVVGLGLWQSVQALVQFARGQPTPAAWTGVFAAVIPVRASGTVNNPNVLATILLLAMSAAAAAALSDRRRGVRLAAWATLPPLAVAVGLTFSRAGYLALVALATATAVLLPPERRRQGLITLAAVGLPLLALALGLPAIAFRVHTISLHHGGDVTSRLFTWRDAFAVWLRRPWRGVGAGGLEVLYSAAKPLGWHGTYVLINVPDSADNDLLQWLAEQGLIGMGLLGAGVLLWGGAVARRWRGLPAAQRAAAAALVGGLAAAAVQGAFEITAYAFSVAPILAALLACVALVTGNAAPVARGWAARSVGLAAVAACLSLAAALYAGWRPYNLYMHGWLRLAAGRPAAAEPWLLRAAAADPTSERNQAAAGDAAVLLLYAQHPPRSPATLAAARRHLAAALRLDPYDAGTWSDVAALLRLTRPGTRAAACADQRALRANPYAAFRTQTLAEDLQALHDAAAARLDAGYAAALLPLRLSVMHEHGQTGAEYRQGRADLAADRARWGPGPLPDRPALPVPEGTCAAVLGAAGFGEAGPS